MSSTTGILDQRIDSLGKELQALIAESAKDDAGRKKLLGLTMKATADLEAPIETVWRMIMSVSLPQNLCQPQMRIKVDL